MSLVRDRNTPYKDAGTLSAPIAAGVVIYAGALVAANAAGFVVPGSVSATLTALGRAETYVNNASGANGAASVTIKRHCAFAWANSATDAVTQASLGKTVYIEDDQTVSATSASNARSVAGVLVELSAGVCWVETR